MKNLIMVGVILAFSIQAVNAATVYNHVSMINGGGGSKGCGTASYSNSGSSSIKGSASDGEAHCGMSAKSYAREGVIGLKSHTSISPGSSNASKVEATASTRISGIYLEAATGYSITALKNMYGEWISLTANFSSQADVSAITNETFWGSSAGADLRGVVSVRGFSGTGGETTFGVSTSMNNYGTVGGMPNVDSINSLLHASTTLKWEEPLQVMMRMNGTSSVYSSDNHPNAQASVNSMNSLSFAILGDVFDLPEGFTVNIPEANVFNNRWVDPRISAVPIPAAIWLFGSGLMGLIGFTRKSKQAK